ncbi:MAG: hypothetical protein K6F93_08835 [Lachnospiraceae bacterium]|nr:hypothetical protein [Lachnospiraceae bacterium]
MKRNNVSKTILSKKALLVIVPLIMILAVLIMVALSYRGRREVMVKDYGFAFVNTGRLVGVMRVPGAQTDISEMVCILSPDGRIEIDDEVPEYNGEKLASEVPSFFNNNSYLYIPWDKAVFLDVNLKLKTFEGRSFLIKEVLFDEEYMRREEAKDLLLLSCTKNLFVALKSFSVISSGERFEVDPMELVLFDGYSIRKATVTETTAERESHGIGKDSLVNVGDKTYMMEDFLSVLGLSVERDSTSGGLEKIEVSENEDREEKKEAPKPINDTILVIPEKTFQYCIGYRYDYPENFEVFLHDGEWYQKREEFTSPLEGAPLYGENTIYLPHDYTIVEPLKGRQYKLPAFSRINTEENEDTATRIESSDSKKTKTLDRTVIYDGENYIVTDRATLSWGDSSYTLAPYSYVSFDGNEILEFYDPELDEFKTFILQVDSAKVLYEDGSGVDVINRTVLEDEEPKMLVINDSSTFGSIFD